MTRLRRCYLDIYGDMVEAAGRGAKKSHIVGRTNMNSTTAKPLLEALLSSQLLIREGTLFRATAKGMRYVQGLRALRELVP